MKNISSMSRRGKIAFLVLLSFFVIPVFAGWTADLLKEWFDDGRQLDAVFWAVLLTGLALVGLVAYLGTQFVASTETKLRPPRKHGALVFVLSSQSGLEFDETEKAWLLSGMRLPSDIKEVCVFPPERFPWQQGLRAAYYHFNHGGALKRLVLIGSRTGSSRDSGSQESYQLAIRFFSHYFPNVHVTSFDDNRNLDFEEIDAVKMAFDAVVNSLKAERYDERDIIIDITGGTKTVSVAGVLMTLNKPDLEVEYVSTTTGEVLGFNTVARAASTI